MGVHKGGWCFEKNVWWLLLGKNNSVKERRKMGRKVRKKEGEEEVFPSFHVSFFHFPPPHCV